MIVRPARSLRLEEVKTPVLTAWVDLDKPKHGQPFGFAAPRISTEQKPKKRKKDQG